MIPKGDHMDKAELVHQLILATAERTPQAQALRYQGQSLCYGELAAQMTRLAQTLLALGVQRSERVAIYLEKRFENVVGMFGSALAGAVFVPLNPLLKQEQVSHQINDCQAAVLITSAERFAATVAVLRNCTSLRLIIIVGAAEVLELSLPATLISWDQALLARPAVAVPRLIDLDMAAILYTSGSTGKPKGVVCSHRNLVSGAASVALYLDNRAQDRVLCVLPLSFDYGLSQLTTMFLCGGTAVLMNYLLPQDILQAVRDEQITGLAAIPPLWGQLARLDWSMISSLRYASNSGGVLAAPVLSKLRGSLPLVAIYLMYGLTEAFRSTYLDPALVDLRADSIGQAIPGNEVLVLRADGSVCDADEVGELVHRGPLVTLGYWNDPVASAARFKPLPPVQNGWRLPELAVWSGDLVRRDAQGYLYFVGRNSDLIKISGYRISPVEVEDVLCRVPGVGELAVVGVPHPLHEQALVAVVSADVSVTPAMLRSHCQRLLPAYMVPSHFALEASALPRNSNGKINRLALQQRFATFFSGST